MLDFTKIALQLQDLSQFVQAQTDQGYGYPIALAEAHIEGTGEVGSIIPEYSRVLVMPGF